MKGSEPELLDEDGAVFETNSDSAPVRDGLPCVGVVLGPVPGPVGADVVVTPPTAPLGVPGRLPDAPATAAPGEHFDGTGAPTQLDPGGVLEQFADDVLVHGLHEFDDVLVHGVHELDDVLVHGVHELDDVLVHGVHEFDDVLVHGAHEVDDVLAHVDIQPVCAGLVLPMPWLRSHS